MPCIGQLINSQFSRNSSLLVHRNTPRSTLAPGKPDSLWACNPHRSRAAGAGTTVGPLSAPCQPLRCLASLFLPAPEVYKEVLSFFWKGPLFSGTKTQYGGCMETCLGQVDSIQCKKHKVVLTRMSGPASGTFLGVFRFFMRPHRIIPKSRVHVIYFGLTRPFLEERK